MPGENDEDLFGMQVVASAEDEVEDMCEPSADRGDRPVVDSVVAGILERTAVAVAAHIDRESNSLVGQLGFLPPALELAAVGISRRLTLPRRGRRFPEYARYAFLSTSDAHDLSQLGSNPAKLLVAAPDYQELTLALAGRDGRA
jgi:3',5'-nucleoside bisphosphate phosphatase